MTKKPGAPERCYLCERIEPKTVFDFAHKLWSEKKVAHKAAQLAVTDIKNIYKTSPTALGGFQSKTIIAGLLYIYGFVIDHPVTQNLIWEVSDVVPCSTKNGYRKLLPLLDESTQKEFKEMYKRYTGRFGPRGYK